VNGAAWQETATASVASGSTVNLGPQPLGGTWNWTGPGGFTSTSREIDGIPLTVGTDAFVATYTNSNSCKSTETFTITVTGSVPSFTLVPSASSVSVTQGSSTTDTITVTDLNGFKGSVNLVASGLPSGVTMTFGTNPTTGSSLLTLVASSTATIENSKVTISGTSGTLTASATIALTVNPKTTGSACTIDYVISPQNSTAFGATLTLVNNSSIAWTSWTLTWAFTNGQTVSSLWNGNEIQSGANVTVTNENYNGSIAAGANYTGVGFNGAWNGTTNAIPTTFSINGTACTVN
jgi:hypothetical protein